jgi:hypothetical protein
MVGIDEILSRVTDYTLEVTSVPTFVCSTNCFHVFRGQTVSFLRDV